jgi:hypothetical protein
MDRRQVFGELAKDLSLLLDRPSNATDERNALMMEIKANCPTCPDSIKLQLLQSTIELLRRIRDAEKDIARFSHRIGSAADLPAGCKARCASTFETNIDMASIAISELIGATQTGRPDVDREIEAIVHAQASHCSSGCKNAPDFLRVLERELRQYLSEETGANKTSAAGGGRVERTYEPFSMVPSPQERVQAALQSPYVNEVFKITGDYGSGIAKMHAQEFLARCRAVLTVFELNIISEPDGVMLEVPTADPVVRLNALVEKWKGFFTADSPDMAERIAKRLKAVYIIGSRSGFDRAEKIKEIVGILQELGQTIGNATDHAGEYLERIEAITLRRR